MSRQRFQVKPVRSYEEARYFAVPIEDEPSEERLEERHHPLTYLVLMLVVLGLSVGLIGCYMRSDYHPDPTDTPTPPDPPDPPPGCDEALRCADGWTLETCADGEWTAQSCDEYCEENYGWEYSSYGCDAEAEDPCSCEYDIIDGGDIECSPGELYCVDEETIEYCDYDWYETMSCHDYCLDFYGEGFVSGGCDEAAGGNPCQCHEAVEVCDPEEQRCVGEFEVELCVDGELVTQGCDAWCVEVYGADYFSNGCSDDAEELCQCEYGLLEGDPAECYPGEVICFDDETLGVCPEDGSDYWYVAVSCDELCVEAYGEGALSAGCDASDADNPCLCETPDSGSGSGE